MTSQGTIKAKAATKLCIGMLRVPLLISLCTLAVSGSVAVAQIGEDTAPWSQDGECGYNLASYERGPSDDSGTPFDKPCNEEYYQYVMGHCSASFKTRAQAARARCTGASNEEQDRRVKDAQTRYADQDIYKKRQNPFAQQDTRGTSSGPSLVRGLTQAQCAARGGRITTFTNTAGVGQDVGECLVPPRVAASSSAPPAQQGAPSSTQAPIQLPQPGIVQVPPPQGGVAQAPQPTPPAGPAAPERRQPPAQSPGLDPNASPRVAALPPDQPRNSSGASSPTPQDSASVASMMRGIPLPTNQNYEPDSEYCRAAKGTIEETTGLYGEKCLLAPAAKAEDGGTQTVPPRGADGRRTGPPQLKAYPPRPRPQSASAVAAAIREQFNAALAMPDGIERDAAIARLRKLMDDNRIDVDNCGRPRPRLSGRLLDIPLRWDLSNIVPEAIERSGVCDGVADADLAACQQEKYGEAVMWAEPDIDAQCRAQEAPDVWNTPKVAACAKNTFINTWMTRGGHFRPMRFDTALADAPCDPPQADTAPRDTGLRRTLAENLRDEVPPEDDKATENKADQPRSKPDAPAQQSGPVPEENAAWCNFMADKVRRGELTPGVATAIPAECTAKIAAAKDATPSEPPPPSEHRFSMTGSENDAEIRRMLERFKP